MSKKKHQIYPTNCIVCGTNNNRTRHHIVPKRYSEMSGLPIVTTCLCSDCHEIVEKYYLHFDPFSSREAGELRPFYEKHMKKPRIKVRHFHKMKMKFSDYIKKEENTNVFGFYYKLYDIAINCARMIINEKLRQQHCNEQSAI